MAVLSKKMRKIEFVDVRSIDYLTKIYIEYECVVMGKIGRTDCWNRTYALFCAGECEIVSVRNVGGGPPAYPNASSALYAGFYYLVQEKSRDHPRYQHADPQSGAYLTYSKANLGGHSGNRWQFFGYAPS